MSFKERLEKIKESAETIDEMMYQVNAEYLFKRYEYMAFDEMINMKWELAAVGL